MRTGRFTGVSVDIVTVAESLQPITTMGGLRLLPDALLADIDPGASDLLVLPGAEMWDAGGGAPAPPPSTWPQRDAGAEHYEQARAVADGGLVTAGPDAPVQFARATFALLGLMPEAKLEAYEDVFARGDSTSFPALMETAAAPAAQVSARAG